MSRPKIVILGAGYGGMITTKRLEKLLNTGEADVTLINKHDYHYITTQLHKTGAGTARDGKIILPIRELINNEKVMFKKATVTAINFDDRNVLLQNGEKIRYDYLLVALGFEVETFGIPGIKEHAFEIRSFRSSKAIINHIKKQFVMYKEDQDEARLTFAVAGAGFTGIEMVGELFEKLPKLAKEYQVPYEKVKIVNIEASPKLLPEFDQSAIDYTTRLLEKKGVEVLTSTKIMECTKTKIVTDQGEIPTRTLIWSCGVRGHRLFEEAGLETVRGKLAVNKYLQVPQLKNVFCIGDNSLFITEENKPLPPTAQVALQQAPVCGDNIVAAIRGTEMKEFNFNYLGSVASISDFYAVGKVGNFVLKGKIAAIMKQIIEAKYLFYLGGLNLIAKQLFGRRHSQSKSTVKQSQ